MSNAQKRNQSVGMTAEVPTEHPKPEHFRRKSHMIAGILSDNMSDRSLNSANANFNRSIEPMFTLDQTHQSDQQFKIKVRAIGDETNSISNQSSPVRSQTELGSPTKSPNKISRIRVEDQMLKSPKRAKQTPKRLPPIKGYTEQNSAPQTLNYSPIVTKRDPILDDSRTSQQLAVDKQGSMMTIDQREIRLRMD